MSDTKYTVVTRAGDVLGRNLTAAEAAHEILTYDGGSYEIRRADDEAQLWTRKQVANKPWTRSVVLSVAADAATAEAEIMQAVVDADWPGHPEAFVEVDAGTAQVVQDAIDHSISHDDCVSLDYTPELEQELGLACDDSAENGDVLEFWGERDGEPWRVHLTRSSVEG